MAVKLHDNMSSVSGGLLIGTYIAYEVHFHWGMNDIVGSEHTFNGKRYPMEVGEPYTC